MDKLEALLAEVSKCQICKAHLPFAPKPVLRAKKSARILVIGQAPGTKVQASGIPWDDASGKRLRAWMDIPADVFYDESKIAIIPMGLCYPGTGKSGDLPPRKECAPEWHGALLNLLPEIELTVLIGQYAQNYYLRGTTKKNLTETVKHFHEYAPKFIPTVHPSPRNQIWLSRNPWFEVDLVPYLRERVHALL